MLQANGHSTRATVEFDKLVIIVIALAVLLIVVIFFKTGFGSMGGSVGSVSKNATGQTPTVTQTMSTGISKVMGDWTGDGGTGTGATEAPPPPTPPGRCCSPGKGTCATSHGICMSNTDCNGLGTDYYPRSGATGSPYECPESTNVCCCSSYGPYVTC